MFNSGINRLNMLFKDIRFQRLALLAILLLAFTTRLSTVVDRNQENGDRAASLVGDEPGYDNTARELIQGLGFTWPGRVPLYPVWLAGVYLVTGGSYETLRYAQIIPALVAVLLTFWLGRRQFGASVGLLAALMVALSYPLIQQVVRVLSEVLYTPFVLLVTLALYRVKEEPTRGGFVWLGILIGLSNLVRPTMLMLPVLLLFLFWTTWGWRQGIQRGFTVLAISLLVASPWVIHNTLKYHAFFPLQTSNALLWQGSPEYFHLTHDQGYSYKRIWSAVIYGPGWETHDPTSIAGDRYWTQRAIESIRAEPMTYLRYAFEKLFTFWVGDPNADWFDTTIFNYQVLVEVAGFTETEAWQIMLARFVPILAVGAICLLRSQWQRLAPILVMLAYFNLLHAATHAEVRLSEPLLPLLFVLIAAAIVQQGTRLKRVQGGE